MKWFFLIVPGMLVAFLILLTAPVLLSLPFVLLLGWWPAVKRLAANSPFTSLDLAAFAAGCVLFLLGLHGFLRRLMAWKLRWSVATSATVAFVLLSIMCLLGMAHQVGWILLSSEPMLIDRSRGRMHEYVDLLNTANVLAKIAPMDLPSVNAATLLRDGRIPDLHDGKCPWEKYHALSLGATGEYVIVVWPRDQRVHAQVGTAVIDWQGGVSFEPTNYTSRLIGSTQPHAAENY